jgi:hypothetical protein
MLHDGGNVIRGEFCVLVGEAALNVIYRRTLYHQCPLFWRHKDSFIAIMAVVKIFAQPDFYVTVKYEHVVASALGEDAQGAVFPANPRAHQACDNMADREHPDSTGYRRDRDFAGGDVASHRIRDT